MVQRVLTLVLFLALFGPAAARGQTIDDGVMMPKGDLFVGGFYTHDSWSEYWEGELKRDNGNIGTLTTETNTWFANYGLTRRINIIGSLPYVWTDASQGVLHSMQGVQDLVLAGKFSLVDRASTPIGDVKAIAVGFAGIPLTDYTPDFQPLSIGLGSRRFGARFIFNAQTSPGWFANGSTAYTWRSDVTLDRPYYFTDNQFFMTSDVDMSNLYDYVASAGYMKHDRMFAFELSQQWTLGGGDIRRQDMPFVSNRMDFTRVGGMAMVPIPKIESFAVRASYDYTVHGRNVGQAHTFTVGLLYRFRFIERSAK
jgi:hypothetical protein